MNIGKTGQIIKNIAIDSAAKVEPKVVSKIAEDVVCFGKEAVERTLTKLSKNVDFRPTGKEFRYVSLPKGLDIVDGIISGKAEAPIVAIIDQFSELGNERLGKKVKIPHGKIVSKIMTNGLEDKVGVLALDATPNNKSIWVSIREALEEVLKQKKDGKDIKALNLSMGMETDFEFITERMGKIITADNIKERKKDIIDFLKKSERPKDKEAIGIIEAINELVKNGIEVYTSSGNNGAKGFDFVSLSKAQHIVSANDYSNATKCLANETAKGVYKFKLEFDEVGGFKSAISDGLKFDIKDASSVSKPNFFSKIFKETEASVCGTSFSCPTKLNEDLRQKL